MVFGLECGVGGGGGEAVMEEQVWDGDGMRDGGCGSIRRRCFYFEIVYYNSGLLELEGEGTLAYLASQAIA